MPRLRINGTEISYYDSGRGLPLVFLHGFPLSRLMWLPQLDHFVKRGYRVIAIDLRGFGDSGFDPGNHSIDAMSKDVEVIVRNLGLTRVVLVGLSMGGYVALNVWRRNPGFIAALVLSNTRAEGDDEEARKRRMSDIEFIRKSGPDAFIESFIQRILSRNTVESKPWVADYLRAVATRRVEVLEATIGALMNRPSNVDILKSIRVPTLIIGGEEDRLISAASLSLMANEIPRARLVMISGVGHMSNLENPEAYNKVIEEFLVSTVG
jgi:pimeloyl-ACP methyl ester carboxylesterase